jgi:signal transduction histidine kinase
MKGTISVENKNAGGLKFTIKLPSKLNEHPEKYIGNR